MVPIPVSTSYLYVCDNEKTFETVALSSYPVKAKALRLQGCSTCPNEVSKYFFSNDTHTFTHNCAGPWVLRVYFICGAYYRHCKFDGIDTKILFIPCQMFTTSLILDLLTSSVDYFYVSGDVEPLISSISFLVSTLVVLTVGLGNDMPARKLKDEKMVVPCITFWTVGTGFLYVPWYTNLLPILEDTLSAVLVFPTTLTICYIALNLHKSTVVMSSVKDLDQPFINDHQPLLCLGMQMGVSHVLNLSYGSVITPLHYGIETEKHVSLYESNSLSSLSLIYLNLEDKVRIQEGSIVMNGTRPIWAKQPNSELRDYVWDPG
ncbi:hypothetical protein KY290_018534 [Solanum tuberosum]|uniref:Uncharacterized protein n=1 Tax=Solanum tuberosum TaxID=4113 RepID=A0ABQ7VEJ2_SOLTU|nr:hypothetical protein KY289_017655 [Solanum tuberosum]KAH0762461.1 hypothetical protein KY290_018534 [Solanum tuberosum]